MQTLRARLADPALVAGDWDLSDPVEREAHLAVALSVDADAAQLGIARRRTTTMASVLGFVAALLALHDLMLLIQFGR